MSNTKTSDVLQRNYADYYAAGATEWRRLGALGKADNIVALCRGLHASSVLEIGAGDGAILQRLSTLRFGKDFYALEISPSGVETIREKTIPELRECHVFDGYNIPYPDNRFDLAILSHVLEHAEHPRLLLAEAARVARYLFVEVPLEDTLRLRGDFVLDSVGHINYYTPTTFRRAVQSCNLCVLDQITSNAPKETYAFVGGRRGLLQFHIKQALLRMTPRIATELFCYHGAIICEKQLSGTR